MRSSLCCGNLQLATRALQDRIECATPVGPPGVDSGCKFVSNLQHGCCTFPPRAEYVPSRIESVDTASQSPSRVRQGLVSAALLLRYIAEMTLPAITIQ